MLKPVFLFIFLHSTAIVFTDAHNLENINSDASKEANVEFIEDLIHQQRDTNSIVFITDTQNENIPYHLQAQQLSQQQTVTMTMLDYDQEKEYLIDRINNANKQDNIPGLYVIIQPEDKTQSEINELAGNLRSYKAKARIIIVFHGKVNMEIYTEKKIYDIYLFSPTTEPVTSYNQYDVCHLCNQGKDAVTFTNIWRKGYGFKHKLQLKNSFNGDFHGKHITMGTWNSKPSIYVTGKDKNGKVKRAGYRYNNYMLMSQMMNFNWKFQHVTSGSQFQLVKNHKPAGLLADLVEGRVMVVGGGWVGRYARYRHADFTASTWYAPAYHIISIEPPKGMPWFGLLKPFTWYMWVLIICSVLADGCTMYAAKRFSGDPHPLKETLWESIVIVMWESIKSYSPPYSMCFLRAVYMFTVFLLVNIYMGEYTATLVSPKYIYPPVDTFQKLFRETDYKILVWSLPWAKQWMDTFQKDLPNIKDRIEMLKVEKNENRNTATLKKLQLESTKFIYINPKTTTKSRALYFSQPGKKKFYYSRERLSNIYCYLLIRKEFEYKEIFNRKIVLMHDMGFMKENYKRIGSPADWVSVDKMNHVDDDPQYMTLKETVEALTVLFAGFFIAFLAFCIEIAWETTRN